MTAVWMALPLVLGGLFVVWLARYPSEWEDE